VVGYFDDWLHQRGWERWYSPEYGACLISLDEVAFLPHGQDGYVMYRPRGASMDSEEPVVCLAAWPFFRGNGQLYGYNVVVLTSKPSPLTVVLQESN
jgi:hypothetical protein